MLKDLSTNTVPLRVRVSIYVFWGDTIQFITEVVKEGFSEIIFEPRPQGRKDASWGLDPQCRGKSRYKGSEAGKYIWEVQGIKRKVIAVRPKLCKQMNTGKYIYTYVLMTVHTYIKFIVIAYLGK